MNSSPRRTTHDHGLITSIAFHPLPGANALAFIDNKGQLTRWNDPIPEGKPPPTDPVGTKRSTETSTGANGRRRRSDSASTTTSSRAGGEDLFRKDQDEDEDEFDRLNTADGFDDWIDDDTNEFGTNQRKEAEEEDRGMRMPSEFGGEKDFVSKGKRKASCKSPLVLSLDCL